MADEAPPNSQQHARANIHVRQVRRTDGRVKTLEQTRRPQLIQTPVVSFLALQHPSTPPDLRQASGRRHAYSPQVWLWLKKKTDSSPCWSDAGTAAAQGVVFKKPE